MGSKINFPIKAPTRQMLYPLSYRGINNGGPDVSTLLTVLVNFGRAVKIETLQEKEIAQRGRSLESIKSSRSTLPSGAPWFQRILYDR
jgi:hypothetical protein